MIREFVKIGGLFSIIIAGIIISGCISGGNSRIQTMATPTVSPIDQKSDVKTSQLMPNPNDVPGFNLTRYEFLSVPQNSSFNTSTEVNIYKDVLPSGYRNVGQTSSWSNKEGIIKGSSISGTIDVTIYKFDTNSELKEYIEAGLYNTECTNPEKPGEEGLKSAGCGSLGIGDYSYYAYSDTVERDPYLASTLIRFSYGNYYVQIISIDKQGEKPNKSLIEAIQFAKIIRSRLN